MLPGQVDYAQIWGGPKTFLATATGIAHLGTINNPSGDADAFCLTRDLLWSAIATSANTITLYGPDGETYTGKILVLSAQNV